MTAPVPDWLREHDDRALAFEERAEKEASAAMRLLLADAARRLAAEYVKAAGNLATPLPPGAKDGLRAAVRRIITALATGLATELPNVVRVLGEVIAAGMRLGTGAAPKRARRVQLRPSDGLAAAVRDLERDLRADIARAQKFAQTANLRRYSDVTTVLAGANRAVNRVSSTTRWVANRAVNEGAEAVAEAAGAPRLWIAMRDACCVPTTRVSVPSLADLSEPSSLVAEDVAQGLALDPPAFGVGLRCDGGPATTTAVTGAMRDLVGALGVSQRDYVGQVVTIRTAGGKQFTGTPNHPVATGRGWVGLAELNVGDYVLSRRSGDQDVAGARPDLDHVEPTIEEVAQAFKFVHPSCVVPVAPEDFHGDGAGSQVGVVWTHRALWGSGYTAFQEQRSEQSLGGTDVEPARLDGSGTVDLRREAGSSAEIALGEPAQYESLYFGGHGATSSEVATRTVAVPLEPTADRLHADALDYGDFLGCLAFLVEPDEVIDVRLGEFRGHVYNLETIEGWYLSDGIVSHNCHTCLAYSGELAEPGEPFPAGLTYGDRSTVIEPIDGPPAHPSCRCRVTPWFGTEPQFGVELPTAIKREAQRSVLRGDSDYASRPEKLRAADRLLRAGTSGLPETVKLRARLAVKAGPQSFRPAKRAARPTP